MNLMQTMLAAVVLACSAGIASAQNENSPTNATDTSGANAQGNLDRTGIKTPHQRTASRARNPDCDDMNARSAAESSPQGRVNSNSTAAQNTSPQTPEARSSETSSYNRDCERKRR